MPSFDFGTGWSTPTGVVAAMLAAAVVVLPRIAPIVALSLAAQVVDYWVSLPVVATSSTFRAIVNVTMLIGMARGALLHRGALRGAAEVVPLLRLEFIILWLAAVLHKLNAGFFDPATTDAAKIFESVLIPFPARLQPWLTVALELTIGLALAIKWARGVGIVLALVFALQTGFIGIPQFASVSLALVILFLSDELILALPSPIPASWKGRLGKLGARLLLVAWPLVLLTGAAIAPKSLLALVVAGWSWLALGTVIAIGIGRRRARSLGVASLDLAPIPSAVVVLLAAGNELGPYVGVKDWPVFSMYSNSGPTECATHFIFGKPLIETPAADLLRVEDGEAIGVPRGSFATERTLRLRLDAYARMGVGGLFARVGPHGERRLVPSEGYFVSEPVGRFFYDYPAFAHERRCFR